MSVWWTELIFPGAGRVGTKAFWELAENRIKTGVGRGEGRRRCLGTKQGDKLTTVGRGRKLMLMIFYASDSILGIL